MNPIAVPSSLTVMKMNLENLATNLLASFLLTS